MTPRRTRKRKSSASEFRVAAGTDCGAAGGGAVPRHVAIIMDGNGRWASSADCRASPAIGQVQKLFVKRCAPQ